MTKTEALQMLLDVPLDGPALVVNPNIPRRSIIELIINVVDKRPDNLPLDGILEKRVWQVFKNQKEPRYTQT